jgi:hypothetical protein
MAKQTKSLLLERLDFVRLDTKMYLKLEGV